MTNEEADREIELARQHALIDEVLAARYDTVLGVLRGYLGGLRTAAVDAAPMQLRDALVNMHGYLRGKDDLYADGAIRQFCEEALMALRGFVISPDENGNG